MDRHLHNKHLLEGTVDRQLCLGTKFDLMVFGNEMDNFVNQQLEYLDEENDFAARESENSSKGCNDKKMASLLSDCVSVLDGCFGEVLDSSERNKNWSNNFCDRLRCENTLHRLAGLTHVDVNHHNEFANIDTSVSTLWGGFLFMSLFIFYSVLFVTGGLDGLFFEFRSMFGGSLSLSAPKSKKVE